MTSNHNLLALIVFTTLSMLSQPLYAAGDVPFAYTGDQGPKFWEELDEVNEACSGNRQSPINLKTRHADIGISLGKLEPKTYPEPINLKISSFAIKMDYKNGSTINFNGKTWELLQFHFHTLSEHAINGELADMELHAVHQEQGGSNLLVIGQLFKISTDPRKRRRQRKNRFLERLLQAGLPERSTDETSSERTIDIKDAFRDLNAYFTYSGSLTTPPCSEVVTWIVLKKPATMTRRQYRTFYEVMGNNFRPLQRPHHRLVEQTFH